jgi:hypothetical protein
MTRLIRDIIEAGALIGFIVMVLVVAGAFK